MDLGLNAVHVVGCGGIGCAVGYALRHAGVPVTFVDANPRKVEWGLCHGVAVSGRPPIPSEFQHFDAWTPTDGAVVLLATKCYDNEAVLAKLPVTAALLPIQNGFDPALDRREHGLEGIASFVSECLPGQTATRITRRGKLHLGCRGTAPSPLPLSPEYRGEGGPRDPLSPVAGERGRGEGADNSAAGSRQTLLAALVDSLRPARLFRVEPVPDILPYKYTKLMYNAAISPLAAAAGIDNGMLLSLPKARALFFDLLSENRSILHSAGVTLGKIGPFHPTTVQRILSHRWLARSLAWAFYPTLRGTYCSMSRDLPAGRTEIGYYNGHLIDLAGDRPCPLNRRVYELVRRMERERLRPCIQMLDELMPLAA